MNTLGIRVKPNSVIFVVFDSESNSIINVEELKIPKALPIPEALKYIRNNILDILREFDITKAGLRTIESNSKTRSIRRIEVEGVIQESFASSMLSAYFCGQISTISAKLDIPRANFKKYITGELDFDLVEDWNTHSNDEKEAILTALGAINA